jgi:glycosyltransferase involved in cell wall biosynthesis
VTVGGLVERKGFHRVIACMPELLATCPELHYLVVGSPGPEGDYSNQLKRQVSELRLQSRVHFLGALPPEGVCRALSAADVFVLSSRNEGWANVLLEAMACGLPVVASDVGGNAEVVCRSELGTIVPFDDHAALVTALQSGLGRAWDRDAIRQYAMQNQWQSRVNDLVGEFRAIAGESAVTPAPCEDAT